MTGIELRHHNDGRQRPYAASAVFNGVVWACGQVPARNDGSVPETLAEQVTATLDNLENVLEAAGSSLSSLLKLTVFLADLDKFDEYNQTYLKRMDGHPLPPRTTVQVAAFRGTKQIEIDAVAAVTDKE